MEHVVVAPERRRGRKRKINNVQNVMVAYDGKKKLVETRSLRLVGKYVRKEFEGNGVFLGRIMSYDAGLYRVNYEDGDFEDLESGEVKVVLVEDDDLTGEWFERKENLDGLLLSKDANAKVSKVDNMAEPEKVNCVDSSLLSELTNGDAGANEEVEVRVDGTGDTDADVDSSSDLCEDTNEGDGNLGMELQLVPPPELPPSSGHIGVSQEYVSHLFSVHSFLRSFSVPLFLYPFGLDDFVGALNCSVANTLLDSVHVALMHVLKRHLERLSSDGSELALKCLRCLDWSLLDTLTWPIYLIHYLMVMGYTNGPDWTGFYTHSLERDYNTLSAGKKLIVLQILCDDVLDSEEIRAEIDMREESEVGIDIDTSTVVATTDGPRRVHPRYSKTSACKDIEALRSTIEHCGIKSSHGTHSMRSEAGEPVLNSIDEDGNGDECRLCGMDGFLLCCDGCPSSYHSRCIGLNKMFMPDGSWYCPECKINATEPRILRGTALKGGENFGVDPYGQVFVATCDHLLVLKASINSETCVRYYNRHNIPGVLHTLNSKAEHVITYSKICTAIMQYWELPQDILPFNKMSEVGLQLAKKEGSDECATQLVNLMDKSVPEMTEVDNTGSCVTDTHPDMAASCLINSVQEPVLSNSSDMATKSHRILNSTRQWSDGCLYMGSSFKTTGYINYYLHGDFAASAAANLAILTSEEKGVPDNSLDNRRKVMSASVSLQAKAFSSAAVRFFWPNTEKKLIETRERCSWCFSCKAPVASKRGCLLNAAATNAIKGAMKVLSGVRSLKNGDGRISGIATYIMFMEETLSGLLVGPFLNDTFRKQWRKQVEQATTCSAIKILLLELEENIRTIALSGDWTKLVEGSTQPSTSQIAATAAASTQKRRPGRRGRKPSTTVEVVVDDCKDILTDFTWWRGGTLSKLMFQKGILPCSMIKKAARQGGSKRISGIHYVEGHEAPKISKQFIWRSAVEMSRNTAQLALQVRYLDFYLRWGDLVRPDQTPSDGKGPEAEASAFRNAFICDKKIVEHEIRYCVAFRSQKHLPSRVMKNIIETEQTLDDGQERYWFSETRIPLYLIKEYEEKVEKNKPVVALSKLQRRLLKASRNNIFSSLFWKQDIMVKRSCCSCHQDIFYRNAVKCTACQGFCHEQCTTSSRGHMTNEGEILITCKKCCESQAVIQIETSNEYPPSPLHHQGRDFTNEDTAKKRRKLGSNKKSSTPVGTLEHSSEVKSTNRSAVAKKSNKLHWGLIWRKKNCEDTGIDFRISNILLRGNPSRNFMEPVCRLCYKPYNADLMYIRCETCKHWYHADAVELHESKIMLLVGFKCCKCRRIRSPVCPYLDSDKKKVLEEKIDRKRVAQMENSEADFDSGIISEHQMEERPAYSASGADNPHLVSLSEFDQFARDKSEADYEWNNTAVSSGPRKLPVRRHIKQENDVNLTYQTDSFQVDIFPPFESNVSNSTEKLPVRRHIKRENNFLDSLSPQVQWNDSKENNFDDCITLDYDDCLGPLGYDDMEFEPQTYFSFNELLASDDGGNVASGNGSIENVEIWEGSSGLPDNGTLEISYDEEEPIISVETDIEIAPCKFCCSTEPCPDLSCQNCGIWIHSHCSPWVEAQSSEDGWRCGSCREWR
ncbi:hypothetical protein BUALT_Bualt13G0063600 [Buddleja alternifolia]|uniref:Uncharacterized protein n=1 Tax=Buddleja alternifolia TaxID=168488 RepID=A0AAV6WQN3_9LAMI|nr:hypothetical protein BUALT_Bualt13G0063600 [Buddleja alternifolia]